MLVLALAGCTLTARLGWWQLDRADQKRQLQARRDERSALPPLSQAQLPSAATDPATSGVAALHERRIALQGRWASAATVYLDNRTMDDHTGFLVITPLLLEDGQAVAVLRGWVPRHMQDRTRLPPLPEEPGRVAIRGRLVPPPSSLLELGAASGPTPGGAPVRIRQNLALANYAHETGLPLAPVMVQQDDDPLAAPANPSSAPALLRHWPRPVSRIETHLGYAAQWFGLSLLSAGLYVWFQILRPRQRRPQQHATSTP